MDAKNNSQGGGSSNRVLQPLDEEAFKQELAAQPAPTPPPAEGEPAKAPDAPAEETKKVDLPPPVAELLNEADIAEERSKYAFSWLKGTILGLLIPVFAIAALYIVLEIFKLIPQLGADASDAEVNFMRFLAYLPTYLAILVAFFVSALLAAKIELQNSNSFILAQLIVFYGVYHLVQVISYHVTFFTASYLYSVPSPFWSWHTYIFPIVGLTAGLIIALIQYGLRKLPPALTSLIVLIVAFIPVIVALVLNQTT